jgi:CO/xanthine dehydrogenase Mo-binding subunit
MSVFPKSEAASRRGRHWDRLSGERLPAKPGLHNADQGRFGSPSSFVAAESNLDAEEAAEAVSVSTGWGLAL